MLGWPSFKSRAAAARHGCQTHTQAGSESSQKGGLFPGGQWPEGSSLRHALTAAWRSDLLVKTLIRKSGGAGVRGAMDEECGMIACVEES
jgi:hypothetical protein